MRKKQRTEIKWSDEYLLDPDKREAFFNSQDGVNGSYRHGRFEQHVEPLVANEFSGEGIPYDCSCEEFGDPFFCLMHGSVSDPNAFEIGIRPVVHEDGSVELQIAEEGSGRHFIFHLKGRDQIEASKAVLVFLLNARYHLARSAFLFLEAFYRATGEKGKEQDEAYDRIIEEVSAQYKSILKWDRHRVIEERETPAGRIKISVPIESGRKPGVGPTELRVKCLQAFTELEDQGRPITQDNVAEVIFPPDLEVESMARKLRGTLRTCGLRWKDLLAEFRQRKLMKSDMN